SFESTTEEDLKWFFDQWITRKSAPELTLSAVNVDLSGDQHKLSFTINQIQKEDPFILDVPLAIVNKNNTEIKNIQLIDRNTSASILLNEKPLKILVDPQFDVMRKLDSREIPPAFTKAYGAKETLIILPDSTAKDYKLYNQFVKGWIKGKEENYTVIHSPEVEKFPVDKTVWILGEGNAHLNKIKENLNIYNSSIGSDSISLNNKILSTQNNSFFLAVTNPQNVEEVVIFLSIGNENAVPGLLRKLPHYGKYSYLAFEGDEPTNIEKGQWSVLNSPLNKIIESAPELKPEFEKRSALAELAPAFSSERMIQHLSFLASSEMKGRGLGTAEIDIAAEYIANKFEEYGLKPGADDNTYYQNFFEEFEGKGKLGIKNVIGIIPGNNENLKEALVISAHYDHLGIGWPDVRSGNEGKIHFGADDNASGVAILLELAKSMGKSFTPGRTIIFVAFSAEEAGLKGSNHFVNNYKKFPSDKLFANLNFDTVGRLFNNKLMILNGNSAREWKFIFMGTEYTTGIKSEIIMQELDASDQVSFLGKGIPAVQFFSGPNEDYHKPGDTIEKIDEDGLVKVATVAKEVIQYLTERKDPLEFTGKTKNVKQDVNGKAPAGPGRRVSTGTMPDFSFAGEGVKVASVAEGSPGALAGLNKGDIITAVNGKIVKSLRDYSNILKEYSPGDKILMVIDRNGEEMEMELILEER
ncbi:MAG: M20/M25/M40 family metallo-hydrolase, partial [Melioribacteraceae bacterium]|nr:M20/M25/M40 family metallo-hydrolase [Melioribacteraceae bacterium]